MKHSQNSLYECTTYVFIEKVDYNDKAYDLKKAYHKGIVNKEDIKEIYKIYDYTKIKNNKI